MQRYIFSVGTYGRCRKTLEEQAKKWARQQQQQTQSETESETTPEVNQGESVVILPP